VSVRGALLLGLGGAALLWALSRTDTGAALVTDAASGAAAQIRGIRNRNPMNIRYFPANQWRGQIANDDGYAVFDTFVNGIRAGVKDLAGDYRDGQDTVRKLISEFAPHSENPTDAYVANVARALNVLPDQRINVLAVMRTLVRAIIRQEVGPAGSAMVPDIAIDAAIKAANV